MVVITSMAPGRRAPRAVPLLAPSALLARAKSAAAGVVPMGRTSTLSERRYELLERTAVDELWAIFWPEGTGLSLHDHGGSSGAFYIIAGALEETSTSLRGRRFERRRLHHGHGKAFGPGYVHSLINPQPAPATTVHAYSPPLTSMTFYSQSPAGLVVSRVVTEWEGAPPD